MNIAVETPLKPGFEDKVFDATASFRAVLKAMSRPAEVLPLPVIPEAPAGLLAGSVAVLLTLADGDTPVWLAAECDTPQARAHLRFHAGCPIVENPSQAAFAVMSVTSDLSAADAMPVGSVEYPDRSATLILESDALVAGKGPSFSGPGIKDRRRFDVARAPMALWPRVAANRALFPRGLDWIFTSPSHLAALPRTTKVEF